MTDKITCPYCGNPAKLVDGDTIYPNRPDLHILKYWFCDEGHEPAYVGCHKPNARYSSDGTKPLGRLADKALRAWKSQAHAAFDPLWLNAQDRRSARRKAYAWLAKRLGIEGKDCHIGMFSIDQCKQVVYIATWECHLFCED
jgi:hypothetical protein